jgi:hypothetical protein
MTHLIWAYNAKPPAAEVCFGKSLEECRYVFDRVEPAEEKEAPDPVSR